MEMNYNMMDDFWMEYGGESQEPETQLWEAEEF